MYEIILGVTCVVCWLLVLGYVFFSKPKTKTSNKSVFLNADVTWGGEDAKQICESLSKATRKATFKGDHRHN